MLAVRHADVVLRPPAPGDVDALWALASDPEVTRWFSWGPYRARSEPEAYVERATRRARRGEQLDLVVVRDGVGVVGVTGLSEVVRRDRRAIIGSWLGREHWGTGVNATAKAALIGLAFDHLGFERLGAYTDVANGRSQTALERVGFRREGVLRGYHRHGEVQKDVCLYGLLLAEAPARRVEVSGELPEPFLVA